MGAGPIPGNAIRSAATRLELDEEETRIFIQVMRRLDGTYLKESRKEAEGDDASQVPAVASRSGSLELFDALFG